MGLLALATLACATTAVVARDFWAGPTSQTDPIAHERLPAADGLRAGPSTDPAILFEESSEPTTTGVGAAPPARGSGSNEDLLYRTSQPFEPTDPATVHTEERVVRPDRETGREPWLTYHAVFDPDPIPFKRNSAKDRVREDGSLDVADGTLRPVEILGNRRDEAHEVFYGSILVELEPGVRVPIPTVAPESRILSVESAPAVPLRFFKDGADNLYVGHDSDHTGRVRLNYVIDAPIAWFGRPLGGLASTGMTFEAVPESLRPALPEELTAGFLRVAASLGLTGKESYTVTLQRLVRWFRDFDTGELGKGERSTYVALALGKKGVCRHRAYAFVVTAHGLGIPARYVANEAHVFVEVFLPGPNAGWLRVDLGGGAQGMDVKNASQKTRHVATSEDPFGFPPRYSGSYSHQAQSGALGGAGADAVRGLPRATGPRGASSAITAHAALPALPVRAAHQLATRTEILGLSASAFRGESLAISGRVSSEGPLPPGTDPRPSGTVTLRLLDPSREDVVKLLGEVATGPDGRFQLEVRLPMDVRPGTVEIVADYGGSDRFAPSRSR